MHTRQLHFEQSRRHLLVRQPGSNACPNRGKRASIRNAQPKVRKKTTKLGILGSRSASRGRWRCGNLYCCVGVCYTTSVIANTIASILNERRFCVAARHSPNPATKATIAAAGIKCLPRSRNSPTYPATTVKRTGRTAATKSEIDRLDPSNCQS